jgi:hypothetical protein
VKGMATILPVKNRSLQTGLRQIAWGRRAEDHRLARRGR